MDSYGDRAAKWQFAHHGSAPSVLDELGSAAIVPLAAGDQILGVLLLIKMRGEPPFGEPDLVLLQNFAAHAALALQYAKARADQRRLAVFEDRDRIAGDMQSLVIRRLFNIGLGLESLSRLVQPDLRRRVAGLVEDLDATIRDLRHSIFSLQEHLNAERESPGSLDETLLRTIGQAADALGFEPRVGLSGSLDAVVPERVRPDLLATLREALANVARHARATAVSVQLRVAEGELTLDVLDDGVGIASDRDRSSGLANLRRRAGRWGGNLTVEPGGGGGTRLTWTVPLSDG
jgi:signal transduction histidine kinase